MHVVSRCADKGFWGAEGAPILFSEIGFCVASCSYVYIYIYIYTSIEVLYYGAPSTAFRQKCSDASVLSKALVMTESWATEVRACPWPQCDSASGQLRAKHACMQSPLILHLQALERLWSTSRMTSSLGY